MLRVGTEAPDFEAATDGGDRVRLSSLRGRKHVVLFFYPRDFTSVCTREACLFRDEQVDLERHDVALLGVSTDSPERHARFSREHRLGYTLVSDEDGAIARRYDAYGPLRRVLGQLLGLGGGHGMAARVTYVIDKQGIIRAAFHSELDARAHVQAVRKALDRLGGA